MEKAVYQTDFKGLALKGRGKVRDIYDLGEHLLIVASDRISAFDVVMAEPIPGKGRVLTAISRFWFEALADIVPNHLVSMDPEEYPEACRPFADDLAGRSMLVKKAAPLPIECIVRGYLAGSGYKDYLATGLVCGYRLPPGLEQAARLEEPLFTPSTKAELGTHDENITVEEAKRLVDPALVDEAARPGFLTGFRSEVEKSLAKREVGGDFGRRHIQGDMLRTKIFETSVAARISRPQQEAGEKSGRDPVLNLCPNVKAPGPGVPGAFFIIPSEMLLQSEQPPGLLGRSRFLAQNADDFDRLFHQVRVARGGLALGQM